MEMSRRMHRMEQYFTCLRFKISILLLRNSILVRVKIMAQTNSESRDRNFSVLLTTKTQSRRNLKHLTIYHENESLWTRELAAKHEARTSSLPEATRFPVLLFFFLGKNVLMNVPPSPVTFFSSLKFFISLCPCSCSEFINPLATHKLE